MKSSKSFNNISDKLKATIPKLKPNETVVFQMLNGVPNPEPDEKERSKDPVLFPKVQLSTEFRVYDPYQLDADKKEVGGYVDVGCVDAWLGDSPTRMRTFVPGAGMYSRFPGKFELKGGVIKDEELFEVLFLSPQREGSPCKDDSVEIMFKILDLKAETTATITKVDRLKKVLNITDEMTKSGEKGEKDAKRVFSALNQPTYQDREVLMAKIKDFAINNVELFIKTYESTESHTRESVKEAYEKSLIVHNTTTGDVTMGGTVLTTMKLDRNASIVDELTTWISNSDNGKDVLANIKSQLAKTVVKEPAL